MSPGIAVFPSRATRSAPAGIVTDRDGPTDTTRPSRTRIVASRIGGRSVPSMTVRPVNARVVAPDCAVTANGAKQRTAETTTRVTCIGGETSRLAGTVEWTRTRMCRRRAAVATFLRGSYGWKDVE